MSSPPAERATTTGVVLSAVPDDAEKREDVVFAIDPGGTTGWAVWTNGSVKVGQTKGQIEFMTQAWEALLKYRPTIVIETYTITQRTATLSRQYEALELIGALRWGAHLYGLEFVMQAPRAAKLFSTDEKLKTVGFYKPGVGHGNDAARHLLLYLATNRREASIVESLVGSLDQD
jgi:hypothetical protein